MSDGPGLVESANTTDEYACGVADDSFEWYKSHAIRSRKLYQLSELTVILLSAAIPVSALVAPGNSALPGVLGAAVVVLSGVRGVFHWQENYLRFSEAREADEAERRLYRTATSPYEDAGTRAQVLVAAISRIEQGEMRSWIRLSSQPPKPDGK